MLHGGEQAPGRRARWALAIATLLLPAATPLRAQPTILVPGTVFRPPVPPPAIGFGRVVGGRGQSPFRADGSGASLIVGAPLAQGPGGVSSGRVYSFSHPYDANEVTVLDSPSPAVGGQFGAAVAPIDPGDVLIGAPGENGGAGALYRVRFAPPPSSTTSSTTLPPTPPPSIETVPNHPPIAGEAFGAAVAVAGQLALAGAPAFGVQNAPGTAYLIDTTTPGATPRELHSPTPSAGALFGAAVAFSPDGLDAFVGAPFEGGAGHETGAVYRFDAATGGFVRTFANPGTAEPGGGVQDGFGAAVATGTNFVVVGAPLADGAAEGAGVVHVFDIGGSLISTIVNPSPSVNTAFGAAVAVVGSRILVGAPFDDGDVPDGGAVYAFEGDRGSPSFGMPATPIRLALPAPTRSALLGFSIAPVGTGGDVAVGAPAPEDIGNGMAIVFAACGNGERAGEQCDDGNLEPGDGCSATCTMEPPICLTSSLLGLLPDATESAAVFCDCGRNAGDACDDGIACTQADTCAGPGGQCTGTPDNSLCNDGNPCTDDRCDAAAGCVNQPVVCEADSDPCSVNECNPSTGTCSHRALNCDCRTDAECDDSNACNGGELCVRPCKGCNLIRAGRQCCDRELTCQLEFAAPPPGTSCDDHNACTVTDTCQTSGQCAGDALTGVANVCCVFQGLPGVDACAGQRIDPVQKKMNRGATLAQKACGAKKLAKQRGFVRRELMVLQQSGMAAQALARKRGRRPPRITEACRDALLSLSHEPAASARAFLSSAARR
jgi:cysteine-rich repeat protein